ncbi:hypothetical protein [Xenorhabdus lircayensis]|uniref:Uncharacterized protein n=1 Tax=Xenorhabdus lircayensis TaxID=2763499 RepID=A0ABS0U8W6_9GAMM|nr:hypothetical protein [Xenorhabdus lircayensis]MBI6550319.1 hypothetical protein [Xenorhabdus lircayensis]
MREQLRPQLVNFRTSRWGKGAYGAIIHIQSWQSSTGILGDLAHIRVREKVCWQTPASEVQHYAESGYCVKGNHNGRGYMSGDSGSGRDEHSALGPFTTPEALSFTGSGELEFGITQTYQQSDNNGLFWTDIPDSAYKVRRVLSREGNQLRITIHKENQGNPADAYSNTSVVP